MTLPLDRISRRGLLRGACASVLLPLLPSLSWADDPAAAIPRPPKRWMTIVFGNGVHPEHWSATGTGKDMALSKTLTPLEPYRGQFSVLSGLHLFDHLTPNEGPHTPYFTNFLSGAHVPTESPFVLAESCDQFMARTIGQDTPMPSLTLGIEPPPFGLQMGRPAAIGTTVSWSSPTTMVPPMVSPRDVFDALFDTKGMEESRSVLDYVLRDVHDIHGKLSLEDGRKLDAYTESVRAIENRIERTLHPATTGWRPAMSAPDMLRPVQSEEQILRQSFAVRHNLMLNLLTLALHMDKTRIATLVLVGDGSYAPMNFVPEVTNIGLHTLAHHGTIPELCRQYQLTNEYHVGLLATLMGKLSAIDEGGATLLDNSMILFGSNVMDGHTHDADKLPLILAGRGGGTLTPGANLTMAALEDRRLCNLHLALLQRMGVTENGEPIGRFGTSTHPLTGI